MIIVDPIHMEIATVMEELTEITETTDKITADIVITATADLTVVAVTDTMITTNVLGVGNAIDVETTLLAPQRQPLRSPILPNTILVWCRRSRLNAPHRNVRPRLMLGKPFRFFLLFRP